MKILVTEIAEIHEDALALLVSYGHTYFAPDTIPSDEVEVLFIRSYTQVTKSYLNRFPSLKYVIRAGVGTDNIDLQACQARDIKVMSSPGANSRSVAEYILLMILTLLKELPHQTTLVTEGLWRDRSRLGHELSGKTVGLIGLGAVGHELERLLEPFGVTLLTYDIDQSKCNTTLPVLLREADVVTIQVPLTSSTKGLIGRRELRQLKRSAILVNVSRSGIVDEQALVESLHSGRLAAASLDCPPGEPNIDPSVLGVPHLVITPHLAGFTVEADRAIGCQAVQNFQKSLEGES